MPLRARVRTQPTRAVSEAESTARRERSALLAQQRRHRRLLELGATCFPKERTALQEPGVVAEQAISHVLLQSASDANAPPVAADRHLNRTSPAVRRLLSTRRGANALLEEAAGLGQLQSMPAFMLDKGTYPARPLCGVCGDWGDLRCMACGERYCSNRCGQVYVTHLIQTQRDALRARRLLGVSRHATGEPWAFLEPPAHRFLASRGIHIAQCIERGLDQFAARRTALGQRKDLRADLVEQRAEQHEVHVRDERGQAAG